MISRCIVSAGLIMLAVGCEKQTRIDTSAAFSGEQINQGVQRISTHCNTCHGVDGREMEDMLAPPLWAVRAHYLHRHSEPEAFVEAFVSYLSHPKAEDSLMPKSIVRYGLKAPVNLSEEDVRLAAQAIYSGAVERPSWAHQYKKLHKGSDAVWSF